MLNPDDLDMERLGADLYIPPKPGVLIKLQALMQVPDPDILEIANMLAGDVGLSADVLSTVNSAYYGLSRQVSDMRQAAVLLGLRHIQSLVTVYELKRSLSGDACISLERFWDSATQVARISVLIARRLDLRTPLEDFYAVGLFRDCGIAILAMRHQDYSRLLEQANKDYDTTITQLERGTYGVDHTVIGYAVASGWGLPEIICQAILQNHETDIWRQCRDNSLLQLVAVLKMAENISDRIDRGCENTDWQRQASGALGILGISTKRYQSLEQDVWADLQ